MHTKLIGKINLVVLRRSRILLVSKEFEG